MSDTRLKLTLTDAARLELIDRARSLGYRDIGTFIRCLCAKELRAPSMPRARELLGRTAMAAANAKARQSL